MTIAPDDIHSQTIKDIFEASTISVIINNQAVPFRLNGLAVTKESNGLFSTISGTARQFHGEQECSFSINIDEELFSANLTLMSEEIMNLLQEDISRKLQDND